MSNSKPKFLQAVETYMLERSVEPKVIILNKEVYEENQDRFVAVLESGKHFVLGTNKEYALKEYPNIHVDFTSTIPDKDIIFLTAHSIVLSQFG